VSQEGAVLWSFCDCVSMLGKGWEAVCVNMPSRKEES